MEQRRAGMPEQGKTEMLGVEGPLGGRSVVLFVHDGYQEEPSCESVVGGDGPARLPRHLPPRVPGLDRPRDPPGARARVPVPLAGCPGRSPAVLHGVDQRTRRGRLRLVEYARPGRTRRALGDRRRPQPGTRTGHRQVRDPHAQSRPRADAPRARCCSPGTPPASCRRRAPRASTTRCPTSASRPARKGSGTKTKRHNSSTATRSCASTRPGPAAAARFSYDTTRMPHTRPESAPSTTVSGPPGCAGSWRPGRRPPNWPPLHGTAAGLVNRPTH